MIFSIVFSCLFHLFGLVWAQKYLANIKNIQNFFDWVLPEII